MRTWRMLQWGIYLLFGSLVLSGQAGRFMNPLVIVVMVIADLLADWFAGWARTNHGARQVLRTLGVGLVVAFVLGVRQWSVGIVLVVVGNICNLVAIQANGLRMPIPADLEHSLRHMPRNSRTRHWWLCDCIVLEDTDYIVPISIGDILQVVGWWVFSVELWLARL